MAFATLPQLEDYMRQTFDAPTELTALQALDVATQVIRTYTGQSLEEVSGETVELVYGYDAVPRLPQRPVTAVSSVIIDGISVTNYLWTADGWLYEEGGLPGYWPHRWRGNLVATYTHGYPTIPDDIRGVCLAVAARGLENPTNKPRESVGSVAISYAEAAFNRGLGFNLSDEEKRLLDAYRPVVVA